MKANRNTWKSQSYGPSQCKYMFLKQSRTVTGWLCSYTSVHMHKRGDIPNPLYWVPLFFRSPEYVDQA